MTAPFAAVYIATGAVIEGIDLASENDDAHISGREARRRLAEHLGRRGRVPDWWKSKAEAL